MTDKPAVIEDLSDDDRTKLDEYFTNPKNALQADLLTKYFKPPVKPASKSENNIFDELASGIGSLFGGGE